MTADDKIIIIDLFEYVQKHMTDFRDVWEAMKAFEKEYKKR